MTVFTRSTIAIARVAEEYRNEPAETGLPIFAYTTSFNDILGSLYSCTPFCYFLAFFMVLLLSDDTQRIENTYLAVRHLIMWSEQGQKVAERAIERLNAGNFTDIASSLVRAEEPFCVICHMEF